VLINGGPSSFFKISRGLWQGFPLSPLLFILVMDGLSHLIEKEKVFGNLSGVKILVLIRITHFFS